MDISTLVAYRIYSLQHETKAIAFNTQSKRFMFLEGLSAELFQLVIDENHEGLQVWLSQNELTKNDVDEFVGHLWNFGFFDKVFEPDDADMTQSTGDENRPLEQRPELNLFQNVLRKNGLYYCFHIDLTNRCNEKCIHCYHSFDQYDYSKELTTSEVKSLVDMIYDLGGSL